MITLLQARRSIRKYQADRIAEPIMAILQEAVLRSPSSRGINPWEFVFVDDPALLTKLSAAKEHGSAFLKDAALGVVVCADETKSDAWVEDCAIASIILQLTAHSLGLGSCWIQIRNRLHDETISAEQYIRQVLGLPAQLNVESIISIGYPAEVKKGHPALSLAYPKIHLNRY